MPRLTAPTTPHPAPTRPTAADSLVTAFLEQMAEAGHAGASARAVAARAGASPSAINYHFGSIEQLFGSAQRHALALARDGLEAALSEAEQGGPWAPDALPAFVAGLLDDWARTRTLLAHAEAEALIEANWRPSESAAAWLDLWAGFWERALPAFSVDPALVPIASAMLQSERLGHLARWRPVYDRPALHEICVRIVGRLTGSPELARRPAPWRETAEALSCEAVDLPLLHGPARRVAEAVVAAVDEGGEAALTHRAAALKAGLSLGAVTHYFPNRAALMAAGYASLYQGIVEAARRSGVPERSGTDDIGQTLIDSLAVGQQAPRARAFEVFFVAATRDPVLSAFAARVRYSRGLNTYRLLLQPTPGLDRLDGALASHWVAGAGRRVLSQPGHAEAVRREFLEWAPRLFVG